MAKGLVPEETKHNGHRRAHFHDYKAGYLYVDIGYGGSSPCLWPYCGTYAGDKRYGGLPSSAMLSVGNTDSSGGGGEDCPLLSDGGGMQGGFDARPYTFVAEGEKEPS